MEILLDFLVQMESESATDPGRFEKSPLVAVWVSLLALAFPSAHGTAAAAFICPWLVRVCPKAHLLKPKVMVPKCTFFEAKSDSGSIP